VHSPQASQQLEPKEGLTWVDHGLTLENHPDLSGKIWINYSYLTKKKLAIMTIMTIMVISKENQVNHPQIASETLEFI
jgi:hypothetical protein